MSESGHLTLSFTRVHFVSAFRYACARVCPFVRPSVRAMFVFVYVLVVRARVYMCLYASLQLQSREEEGRLQKKSRGKREKGITREAARANEKKGG